MTLNHVNHGKQINSMGTESHKNRLERLCFRIDGSSSYQTHLLIKIINSGQNIKTI